MAAKWKWVNGILTDINAPAQAIQEVSMLSSGMIYIPTKIMFIDARSKEFGLPAYAHHDDAGFDLRIILPEGQDEYIMEPGERKLFSAGFKMQMAPGFWAEITHRSSTEFKKHLRIVSGTIDGSYRGPILTHVVNTSGEPAVIKHGDRLAQMIIKRIVHAELEEVDELDVTQRNEGGFGSSGQ